MADENESATSEKRWSGVLAPLDTLSGDGRKLLSSGASFRDTPMALRFCPRDVGGHYEAVRVADIDTIEVRDGMVWGAGPLYSRGEGVEDVLYRLERGPLGVSVDLDMAEFDFEHPDGGPFDWDRYYDDPEYGEPVLVATSWRIAAATLVDIPAFQEAYITMEGVEPSESTEEADAVTASGEMAPAFALVAAAHLASVPAEWFLDPNLSGPTPLTIDGDRIYGHLAVWGSCHTGYGASIGKNGCVTPPNSASNYAYFRTGLVETDQGDIPVGHITLGTGHAGLSLGANATAAHYDNTGTVVADVAAGEDAHGIWIAGALRDVPDAQRKELKAAALSGDWRWVAGNYELIGALAVNVPGFPIPRPAMAASAGQATALVASGVVKPDTPRPSGFSLDGLAAKVVDEMERREREKVERQATLNQLRTTIKVADAIDEAELARLRSAFGVQ